MIEAIRAALRCGRAGCTCQRPGGNVHCPVRGHAKGRGDQHPSLSITERDGRVLVYCRANCSQSAVIEALRERGLWPEHATVTRYELHNTDGRLVAVHVRQDRPDCTKIFTWRRPDGAPGLGGLRVADLPLFGVHRLRDRPGEPILLVEGEKPAQALLDAGRLAVGTITGAGSMPSVAALQPLAGREVFLWPDADEPGRQHMARIAERLRALGVTPRLIEWPEAPPAGDAADFVAGHGAGAELDALLASAPFWEAGSGVPGLRFTPLGDLLAKPEEKLAWLVEGHLPTGGLSLLAGKPKTGKSTLARCLALAVARGEPWLDFATQRGVVLYLALEDKPAEVRRHFEAMGARSDDPVFVYCATAPQDGVTQLRRAAETRRPALIIVDPLFRLARVRDANDYAQVVAATEPLIALAREIECHLMVTHHMGKGDRSGGDAILGSTAIFGTVDTALILKRLENYRTLSSIQRYGEDLEEITIVLDPVTRWVTAGPPKQEADEEAMAQTIVEYLAAQAPVEEAAIREAVEGRKALQVRSLRRLVDQGRVIRTGQGRRGDPFLYALPDSGFLVPDTSREPAEPVSKIGQKARSDATKSGSRDSAVPAVPPEMAGTSNGPAEGSSLLIRRARGWRCTSPPEDVRRAVQLVLHRQLPHLARRAAELFDATILEVRAAPARRETADLLSSLAGVGGALGRLDLLGEEQLRQKALEAAAGCGWPQIPCRPGETVGPGEGRWRVFAARAPVDRVRAALAGLVENGDDRS